MVLTDVDGWIDYIQTLHSREIDMTLQRVELVYHRLFQKGISFRVVSISGTNGKGSCAELLSSIYCAAGYQTAKFSSPHLVSFNERYEINGEPVSDAVLLNAFERVAAYRGDVPLTFFEFGTLLAIVLFDQAKVDVAVMEVGLGGRLDATNILDCDTAIIPSISIDHTDWLGDTLDEIAHEKVGITRPDIPCVIGMQHPVQSLIDYCSDNHVPLYRLGAQFAFTDDEDGWNWSSEDNTFAQLPLPFGQSSVQLNNAAVVVQAVQLMSDKLPVTEQQLRAGLSQARLSGRCQLVSQFPHIVLDVSHNVASVSHLAAYLKSLQLKGKLIAVCGFLKDKQIKQCFKLLTDIVDEWYVASIDTERGSSGEQLKLILDNLLNENQIPVTAYSNVSIAYTDVKQTLNKQDCAVVFGSFFIVSDIISFEKLQSTVKAI